MYLILDVKNGTGFCIYQTCCHKSFFKLSLFIIHLGTWCLSVFSCHIYNIQFEWSCMTFLIQTCTCYVSPITKMLMKYIHISKWTSRRLQISCEAFVMVVNFSGNCVHFQQTGQLKKTEKKDMSFICLLDSVSKESLPWYMYVRFFLYFRASASQTYTVLTWLKICVTVSMRSPRSAPHRYGNGCQEHSFILSRYLTLFFQKLILFIQERLFSCAREYIMCILIIIF